MNNFQYKGRDLNGKIKSGNIYANDINTVNNLLLEQKIYPINIKVSNQKLSIFNSQFSEKDASEISRDLARFIRAGLPIIPSLKALKGTGQSKKTNNLIDKAIIDMEKGLSLSSSFSNSNSNNIKILAGIIRVGEKTGKIAEGLEDAARSFALSAEFKGQILGALTYPGLIMIMITAALSIFVTFVIPNLKPLFSGSDVKTPDGIALLFKVSDIISFSIPYIALIILISIIIVYLNPKIREFFKLHFEKITFSALGLGLANSLIYSNISRRLSLALSVGIKTPEAVTEALNSSSYISIKNETEKVLKSIIMGKQLSDSISILPGVPVSLINLTKAGERAGSIAPAMKEAAELLEQSTKAKAERISALFAPLVTIFVGIIGVPRQREWA